MKKIRLQSYIGPLPETALYFCHKSLLFNLAGNAGDCTGRCEELEDTLVKIREDVVEALNAWVVRTHSPILSTEYGLNTKVCFRLYAFQ